jgi:multidrug transporter EmrE-like cation transporter
MNSRDFALILVGVLLNAGGQLLLKAGARALEGVTLSFGHLWVIIVRMLLNPPIVCGLACYAISVVAWTLALVRVPVSVAYPMLSIGYVVNAVAAWWLWSENLSATRLAGIGIIILGVWLVAHSAQSA